MDLIVPWTYTNTSSVVRILETCLANNTVANVISAIAAAVHSQGSMIAMESNIPGKKLLMIYNADYTFYIAEE